MSTGNALIDALLVLAGGAGGTEIIRWLLNRRSARLQESRADLQAEIDQSQALYKHAEELRQELRTDIEVLRKEVGVLRADVDVWKQAYFDLFHTARDIHQQYAVVASYLNAILSWLKSQEIEIPMPIPVIAEPRPLPTIPFPRTSDANPEKH